MKLVGKAYKDAKTKDLIQRLPANCIAVIKHADIDEVSASALVRRTPKAVVNFAPSSTGTYPNAGPRRLIDSKIPLYDVCVSAPGLFDEIQEGHLITIIDDVLMQSGRRLARIRCLDDHFVNEREREAQLNFAGQLEAFVDNTLKYARVEKQLVISPLPLPPLKVRIKGKPVIVVVRGRDYREDLAALAPFIREMKPVLIGVDGGADALLEFGYRPDLIVGDMDSVSDGALSGKAQLLVHAYPDGGAPGLARIKKLGLSAQTIPAIGTSEDLALLLAHQEGADLIVAVGTHSNIIDFLEKGRPGMASTLLVRMKVGPILIDAKGVNKLYSGPPRFWYSLGVVFSALLPLLVLWMLFEPLRQLTHMFMVRVLLLFGR
ncbi:MAG: putative cytokinetic ring protein SteA [Limnochordia bacterium]|nr:putative cytokinetic ring protein SteA [Limnochordia bacterium]MDD2630459.1 putative cytokinetic ring protein SteA [Limnochordia bacterium]